MAVSIRITLPSFPLESNSLQIDPPACSTLCGFANSNKLVLNSTSWQAGDLDTKWLQKKYRNVIVKQKIAETKKLT